MSNTINLPDGRKIPFIEIAGGAGVLATEDQAFIDALELRMRERRGGIYELTQEQYDEELKKKSALPSLPPSPFRRGINLMEQPAEPKPQSNAPAAVPVAEPAQPQATIETAAATEGGEPKISKPTVGKVKR